MRLAVIACQVFNRELSRAVSQSKHTCTVFWQPQGLHDTPQILRQKIRECVETIERHNKTAPSYRKFDAIALCYGMCGTGVCEIASQSIPIVVPRTDDCIGILLGSQSYYRQIFSQKPGIFWYSDGWIEFGNTPSQQYYQTKREDYASRYGEENARYLLEQENTWIKKYQNLIYIASPDEHRRDHEEYARRTAKTFGWEFSIQQGKEDLLRDLVNACWEKERFLYCPPGKTISQSFEDSLFCLK